MEERVRQCSESWHDGKCCLCHDLKGWGCKLITFLPDEVPNSEHDKGRLFAKVYTAAKAIGVLECPHYNELTIDRTLDDTQQLAQMVNISNATRAELLSEEFL